MRIYTIGFTKKNAKEFFNLLIENEVKRVIDIRRRNNSQLAGFAKAEDLEYFLEEIADIEYTYRPEFAPSKDLLDSWRDDKIDWNEYEKKYYESLDKKIDFDDMDHSLLEDACLLCSENKPDRCHRRLLAESIAFKKENIEIVHLDV